MTGTRASDDAPRSSRREDGSDDASNAGDYSGDSDSNMTIVSGYREGGDLAGELDELNIQPTNQVPAGDYSGDSDSNMTYVSGYSEGGDLAGELDELNIQPTNQVPAEGKESAAADGQHEEAEVPPPPPADQPVGAEVADQSVPAAAPAPEMGVPAAEPLCLGCRREPALLRLLPVKHACLGLTCRSNPAGGPRCEVCDGLRH